jgi:hypothetical protein
MVATRAGEGEGIARGNVIGHGADQPLGELDHHHGQPFSVVRIVKTGLSDPDVAGSADPYRCVDKGCGGEGPPDLVCSTESVEPMGRVALICGVNGDVCVVRRDALPRLRPFRRPGPVSETPEGSRVVRILGFPVALDEGTSHESNSSPSGLHGTTDVLVPAIAMLRCRHTEYHLSWIHGRSLGTVRHFGKAEGA